MHGQMHVYAHTHIYIHDKYISVYVYIFINVFVSHVLQLFQWFMRALDGVFHAWGRDSHSMQSCQLRRTRAKRRRVDG